jgi:hypothetical protein
MFKRKENTLFWQEKITYKFIYTIPSSINAISIERDKNEFALEKLKELTPIQLSRRAAIH